MQAISGAPGLDRTADIRFRKPAEGVTGHGGSCAIVLHDPRFWANLLLASGLAYWGVVRRLVGDAAAAGTPRASSGIIARIRQLRRASNSSGRAYVDCTVKPAVRRHDRPLRRPRCRCAPAPGIWQRSVEIPTCASSGSRLVGGTHTRRCGGHILTLTPKIVGGSLNGLSRQR